METAYVMINCELGSEQSIIEQIKTIDGIKEVQGILGNYDIITKIEAHSLDVIRDAIVSEIRKIQNIRSTTTLMCSK